MIRIGLATWTDHPALSGGKRKKISLPEYAEHFSIVEVDSSFYAVPKLAWIQKWIKETPTNFQFIVKANYAMTKTPMTRFGEMTDEIRQQRFTEFKQVIKPMQQAGKLATVLFQFPPSFKCNNENIKYIRNVRQQMGNLPLAIEFRNQSWYDGKEVTTDTAAFLQSLKISEVVTDEPNKTTNSVPFYPVVTNKNFVFVRLHGHNATAWAKGTMERYRYNYSDDELNEIAKTILQLNKQAKEVAVIFNNNTGHYAAPNAESLQRILKLGGETQTALQLDLF